MSEDVYTGELTRDPATGLPTGWVKDRYGWGFTFRATSGPVNGVYPIKATFLKPADEPDVPGLDTPL